MIHEHELTDTSSDNRREFQKYAQRGAYHWRQISPNPLRRNAFVLGRYQNMLRLANLDGTGANPPRLLDVGCGDGVLSYLLAERGAIVTGIDFSGQAIAYAIEQTRGRSGPSPQYQQGSAYQLPFADDAFDAVVSSDVIEHLSDVGQYLREIRRVCKPGGRIVLSTPIRVSEAPLDPEHVSEWFPGEFQALIDDHLGPGEFYYSHPLALLELAKITVLGKPFCKLALNLASLISNPFAGFDSRFRLMSLQYSVTIKRSPTL